MNSNTKKTMEGTSQQMIPISDRDEYDIWRTDDEHRQTRKLGTVVKQRIRIDR